MKSKSNAHQIPTTMKTTIAIATRSGYVATDAYPLDILGIPLGVHRIVGKTSGWAVTHVPTGLRVAAGGTRKIAAARAETQLNWMGAAEFARVSAGSPKAPPADTLKPAASPVRVKAPKPDLERILDAIATDVGTLDDTERQACRAALSSTTGRLKAKAPSEPMAKAAWNGLQPNAWKVQFSCVWLDGAAKALLLKLSEHAWPAILDRDLHTLRLMGVA
jgi:hypothetical protein